jgi:hypothetical protein
MLIWWAYYSVIKPSGNTRKSLIGGDSIINRSFTWSGVEMHAESNGYKVPVKWSILHDREQEARKEGRF